MKVIYEEGVEKETLGTCINSLRAGDELWVASLDRLAPNRRALKPAIEAVHEAGATIVETRTKRRSDDRDALVSMIFDAIDALAGDGKALPKHLARKFGKMGAKKRLEAIEQNRMPVEEARRIWLNNSDLTIEECLAMMPGWTQRMAYRHPRLGSRGLAKGRPRLKVKARKRATE